MTAPGRSRSGSSLLFYLAWGAPPLLWQLIFFVVPFGFLLAVTFWSVRNFRLTPDFIFANWQHILSAGFFRSAYAYTFALAAVTAALASLIAFPAAYTLAFKVSPNVRRILIFLLVVPFFTSYPVRMYSWQIIFSPFGVVNKLLGLISVGPINLLNTPSITILGYLTLALPLVILLQTFALGNVDRTLIEAAKNLGCGPARAVITVLIPAARVGLILAAAFAFVLAFGDYISPLLLGGSKPPTLSVLLADQVKSGNHWPRAAVIAVVMVFTLMVALLVMLGLAYGQLGRRRA
jgi:ABC-type spermidine/putrescine transport system permease subunit I